MHEELSTMRQFGRNGEIINRLLNKTAEKKVRRDYGEEIRKFALTLHFFSANAYKYVRQRFNNCLPRV